jgi:predicted AlkP superfamily pyrophosphatase or phosphodiesterase
MIHVTTSRTHRRIRAALVAASVLLGSAAPRLQQPPTASQPRLVVILVVDQMRVDYLEWYAPLLTKGLRRLRDQGAWFTNAAYPYLNTVTCVGHSTIGTGTFPYHHGMVLNAWLDRTTKRVPGCTEDLQVKEITYAGLKPATGDSARNLMRPALGEQVHQHGGRAVAISLKPRSSIPLVGHRADAIVWFDERGGWSTSEAFSKKPVPFIEEFIESHPLTADQGKVWTRTLDPGAYKGEDDVAAERPPAGMTRTFPHALDAPAQSGSTESFFTRWQRSPFADEYLERLAETAIDKMALGKGQRTDFLAVSFSSLDLVGHVFGPRSQEVQDMLVRVDATIGRLLEHLDRQVGAGNYVLAISADHGVAEIPELVGTGGRQTTKEVKDALEKVFVPVLGIGDHVAATAYTDIYLTPKTVERLRLDTTTRTAAVNALLALPAVSRVFVGTELATAEARASTDPVLRAAALSYYPGRSGDLIIAPKENWLLGTTAATTHGTQQPYDQRVPGILFGAGVRAGHYTQTASPADIAPTLASVARIRIAPTDGRVLSEALVPAAATHSGAPSAATRSGAVSSRGSR